MCAERECYADGPLCAEIHNYDPPNYALTETPTVAGGAVPIVVHLLSPAHRPVQVTSDLASFWRDGYPQVRRELRGRYPKHHWPEDPLTAAPTGRAKRRK